MSEYREVHRKAAVAIAEGIATYYVKQELDVIEFKYNVGLDYTEVTIEVSSDVPRTNIKLRYSVAANQANKLVARNLKQLKELYPFIKNIIDELLTTAS